MNDAQVVELATSALRMAALLGGPFLAVVLLIGVVISLLQTVTQVQEMTLTFVPKLVGVALVLILGGHWMVRQLVAWVTELWQSIPTLG